MILSSFSQIIIFAKSKVLKSFVKTLLGLSKNIKLIPKRELSIKAYKISNLTKNPPKGGIPLIENINNENINANIRLEFLSLLKSTKWLVSSPKCNNINHIIKDVIIYTGR